MAAPELEVSVKGVHCKPKLESNHSKSSQNFEIILWKSLFFNKAAG